MSFEWLHCSNCFYQKSLAGSSPKCLFLTTCGHIYCADCVVACAQGSCCKVCKTPKCSVFNLGTDTASQDQVPPSVRLFFTQPSVLLNRSAEQAIRNVQECGELCAQELKKSFEHAVREIDSKFVRHKQQLCDSCREILRVIEFQNKNYNNLLNFYRQREKQFALQASHMQDALKKISAENKTYATEYGLLKAQYLSLQQNLLGAGMLSPRSVPQQVIVSKQSLSATTAVPPTAVGSSPLQSSSPLMANFLKRFPTPPGKAISPVWLVGTDAGGTKHPTMVSPSRPLQTFSRHSPADGVLRSHADLPRAAAFSTDERGRHLPELHLRHSTPTPHDRSSTEYAPVVTICPVNTTATPPFKQQFPHRNSSFH